MPLSEKQLTQVMQQTIALAKKAAPGAEVLVSFTSAREANVRFARNEVTTAAEGDEVHASLSIKLGQRNASAETNQLDDASLKALVERTARLAALAPENPELMPVLGPQVVKRNDAAFDPAIDSLDAKGRAAIVKTALEVARSRGLPTAGFLFQRTGLVGKATSAGLSLVHPATTLEYSVTSRTASGTGSGRGTFFGRRLAAFDVAAATTKACETAKASENPRRLEAGRYTVILEPAAAGEFASNLLNAMNQRSADEGRSFFSKAKLGEKLFSELVTLRSDPRSAATPGLPFEQEGRVLDAQPWVTNGTLSALAADRYWAKKTNRSAIGGHSGFELAKGTTPRAKLLEGITRGVLISRVWYTNWVDAQTLLLTGLTRDGTFLIENGAIAGPVNNFRFNQSVAETFARVEALSVEQAAANDAEALTPAMRIADFNLASVSEAV